MRVTARRVCLSVLVLLFTIPPPAFRSGWWLGGTQKRDVMPKGLVLCLWVGRFGTLLGPEETLVVFSGSLLVGFP